MQEISEELTEIEKSANKSSSYIHQLNEAILKRREVRKFVGNNSE